MEPKDLADCGNRNRKAKTGGYSHTKRIRVPRKKGPVSEDEALGA